MKFKVWIWKNDKGKKKEHWETGKKKWLFLFAWCAVVLVVLAFVFMCLFQSRLWDQRKITRQLACVSECPPPSQTSLPWALLSLAHIQPHNRRLRPRRGIQKWNGAGSAHTHLILIVLCHCCYKFSIASLFFMELFALCMCKAFLKAICQRLPGAMSLD